MQDIWDIIRHPHNLMKHYSWGFVCISATILVGQIIIVNVFGEMFGVAAINTSDWLWLLLFTSPILVIGELFRLISLLKKRMIINKPQIRK